MDPLPSSVKFGPMRDSNGYVIVIVTGTPGEHEVGEMAICPLSSVVGAAAD
jgi:hypothetical protein